MSMTDSDLDSGSSSSSDIDYNIDTDTDVDTDTDIDCEASDSTDDYDFTIQYARDTDLDAISSIGIASFPSDPQWNYRYPYRQQYPDDHVYFARKRYAEWLAASRTPECMITVIEGRPKCTCNSKGRGRILAFAIWRLPSMLPNTTNINTSHKMRPPTNKVRRDANYAHMKAYQESSMQAEKRYFDPRFGPRRMDLAQLVTDPGFRRRGLATKLVRYGQRIATQYDWAVGVFASPMGETLYQKLGFETLGQVLTQADNDDETLEFPAMAWKPAGFQITSDQMVTTGAQDIS